MAVLGTKVCTECGAEKFLERFYPKKGGRQGRTSQCKECIRGIQKEAYAAKKGG